MLTWKAKSSLFAKTLALEGYSKILDGKATEEALTVCYIREYIRGRGVPEDSLEVMFNAEKTSLPSIHRRTGYGRVLFALNASICSA